MRRAWAILACLALVAPASATIHLHRVKHAVQMRMTPVPIPANGEREVCEYRTTPNKKPMDVAAFELATTPGTHHFVLWEYLGKDTDPKDFWKGAVDAPGCIGIGPQDGFATTANLFGMLSADARVPFPPGVAVRLPAHAIVYEDLHLHNYHAHPIRGQAVFNLIPAKPGTVRHHAQSIVVGSFDIHIPPLSHAALTGEWHTPNALNLVQISTHQHHRGTRVTVDRVDPQGNDLGPLVVSTQWDHPSVRWFPEILRIPAGEGIRFTCEWQNDDDHPVTFGVTTDDEMCFVDGYFYPDVDGAHLTGPGCAPQGAGLECFVAGH
jgi:hypothetical protein